MSNRSTSSTAWLRTSLPLVDRQAEEYPRSIRGLRPLGIEDHGMDVAAWLRGLGLEQYAQHFRDNDIGGEILCGMTAEDLKELGISSFGHRRRLLNAIASLGGGPPTRDVAETATS